MTSSESPTHMVTPSDQIPVGLLFPAPLSVLMSRLLVRRFDSMLYAYSLESPPSATHIVVPLDQIPLALVLPAAYSRLNLLSLR